MKRILLLGGNGFLGSALTRYLSTRGFAVTSLSRKIPKEQLDGVRYVGSNYENIAVLSEELRQADTVIHLAWDTTPASSSSQPSLEIATNLAPLSRLIEAMQRDFNGCLLFVSSGGAVYGQPEQLPHTAISESLLPAPLSYYGASKVAAESLLHAFSSRTGTPVTVLRPSNIYGPGQLPKKGFAVIPTLLTTLRENRVFEIVGNMHSSRDYLYVDDFCHLLSMCIQKSGTMRGHETYNVCSGHSTTLAELIGHSEKVSGNKAKLRQIDARKEDPNIVELSGAKADDHFSWSSETSLTEGLESTWQWINNLNLS